MSGSMNGWELSVSLEYMFREAGELPARVAAAAKAGVTKGELFTTADVDLPVLRRVLDDHGFEILTVVNDPRTALVDPATHDGFIDGLRRTAEAARELGCSRVVVPSGIGVPYLKRPVQLRTVADAIAKALPMADELDVTFLLEPVNTRVDHPGVLFGSTEDPVAVIEMLDSPRVRLLYDVYHSVTEKEDPWTVFPAVCHLVDHVQVADAPGRGEPGSGTIDWPAVLALLQENGYDGVLGVECSPTQDSTGALAYIAGLARGSGS